MQAERRLPERSLTPPEGDVEAFTIKGYSGLAAGPLRAGDTRLLVSRLTDPAAAAKTLHWGRNYLYVVAVDVDGEPLEVVVKQFRNTSWRARWRRRRSGSKAERSWRIARAMIERGLATPEPLMLIEADRSDGPSFYVSRYLGDALEARYLFRAVNAGRAAERFPGIPVEPLLDALGRELARLHEAGIWHRDLSAGNLLVTTAGDPAAAPRFVLVDLNRARLRARLGPVRRSRDLSRLMLHRRADQRRLLASYWGTAGSGLTGRWLLFLLFHEAFRLKHRTKRLLRTPRRLIGGRLPRRPHAHIPQAPPAAGARDKIVWDRLSDQPHQHASRLERARVRLGDAGQHAAAARAALAALPRSWRRYRSLRAGLYGEPVPWGGVGVALGPRAERVEEQLALVEELGVRHVLLRLHPWEQDQQPAEELARSLAGRGIELVFALPQNRDLVRDPAGWAAAVERIAERFVPFGRAFQIGQAINRSKWGVWTYQEYLSLAGVAAEILRRHGDVTLLGPAVIDFEPYAVAAALNLEAGRLHFDKTASLLYVDRRGAPENRQLGFDAVGKALLLAAIAGTSRNADGGLWITEVNWPLWEGPHSPAGRSVAVDEELQADYLARYYLLMLTSGAVERVFWWQLIARGYGLVDPAGEGRMRCRPSFAALRTLTAELAGATFVRRLPAAAGARVLAFARTDGRSVVAAWSHTDGAIVTLPRPAVRVVGRDGGELPAGAAREVTLTGSPCYFLLAAG